MNKKYEYNGNIYCEDDLSEEIYNYGGDLYDLFSDLLRNKDIEETTYYSAKGACSSDECYENFKENVETNLEHYKDGIIELCIDELAISKGKVVECCAIPCSECDFEDKNGHCIGNHEIMKWLKQPYKKLPYKLSQF